MDRGDYVKRAALGLFLAMQVVWALSLLQKTIMLAMIGQPLTSGLYIALPLWGFTMVFIGPVLVLFAIPYVAFCRSRGWRSWYPYVLSGAEIALLCWLVPMLFLSGKISAMRKLIAPAGTEFPASTEFQTMFNSGLHTILTAWLPIAAADVISGALAGLVFWWFVYHRSQIAGRYA